jgi:hypothetical protein
LHFLELANAGLESLPDHFGYFIPNARVVNLNFNGLKDLRPLQGIVRLRKLTVVGNRLTRLRKTASVVAMFSSIAKVDLRDNPLTVGFYPPVTESTVALRTIAEGGQVPEAYEACLADADEDEIYRNRLDSDTKLRRRVYEMLLANGCPRISMIDGLPVNKAFILRRDDIWSRLVEIGVLRDIRDQSAPGCDGPVDR